MTRREEIVKATKECREDYVGLGRHLTSDDIADAFEAGAEWMHKKMIDKAVEWLHKYFVVDHYGMSTSGFCVFADMFRKAMEE